jgi:archaellum component FlaF (FlaF/FlaG flagellin family)
MIRELQAQKDALASFQENMQPGRISGVVLYFNGKNATGVTSTIDDLGTAIIKRNGRTLINRPMGVFASMGNIRAGSNLFSSTEASDFVASVFIPFYALSFEQALEITDPSELNFEWNPDASISSNFDNLQVSVYAQKSFRQEYYEYYILGNDESESAAVTSRPYQMNRRNITELYLRDPDDVITSITLRQNGDQVYSNQPWDVLVAGTLYDNLLEVNNFSMVQLETYTKGQPLSTQNRDTIIELTTSGGGTAEITVCSIEPNQRFLDAA